jgi:hypothetical protein
MRRRAVGRKGNVAQLLDCGARSLALLTAVDHCAKRSNTLKLIRIPWNGLDFLEFW